MLEGFQFYADCGLEKLLVEQAVKFNTAGGFISSIINLAWVLTPMFIDTEWQQSIVGAIEKANFSGNNEDWAIVGKYVGKVFASILEFQVPSSEYMYGMSVLDELYATKSG